MITMTTVITLCMITVTTIITVITLWSHCDHYDHCHHTMITVTTMITVITLWSSHCDHYDHCHHTMITLCDHCMWSQHASQHLVSFPVHSHEWEWDTSLTIMVGLLSGTSPVCTDICDRRTNVQTWETRGQLPGKARLTLMLLRLYIMSNYSNKGCCQEFVDPIGWGRCTIVVREIHGNYGHSFLLVTSLIPRLFELIWESGTP